MGYIFISYSHKDKSYAHKLQKALQDEGFDVWIDDRINYGTTWPRVIQRHLDDCSAFILVMTENAYESEWVQNEVARARRKKKPFFTLLLGGDTWLSFETLHSEGVSGERLPQENFYRSLARVVPRKKVVQSHPSGPALPKTLSILGIVGSIGIIIVLLWGGSWAISQFILFPLPSRAVETPQPVTNTPATRSPVMLPETVRPALTPTISPVSTSPTPTLGIGALFTRSSDKMKMVYVPEGEFIMGTNVDEAIRHCLDTQPKRDAIWLCQRSLFSDEGPVHTVYLNAYWIDQTEVTDAMYALFLNKKGNQIEGNVTWLNDSYIFIHQNEGIWSVETVNENYPVRNVSWYGARAYCDWAGGYLPTEAQWEKAARGDTGQEFPWGNEAKPCNFANHFNCGGLSVVGASSEDTSPYGALDMAANVREWTADFYDPSYYSASPMNDPLGPSSGDTKVVRGSGEQAAIRNKLNPSTYDDKLGFRCARDANP